MEIYLNFLSRSQQVVRMFFFYDSKQKEKIDLKLKKTYYLSLNEREIIKHLIADN